MLKIRFQIEGILFLAIAFMCLIEGFRLILYKDPVILYDALGPGHYILVLGLALLATAGAYIIDNYKKPIKEKVVMINKSMRIRMISMTVVLIIYAFLINILGYLLVTFFFFLTEFRIVGIKSWRLNLILAIVLTALYYMIFVEYAKVVFPKGIFF